jgi:hypothetical protein
MIGTTVKTAPVTVTHYRAGVAIETRAGMAGFGLTPPLRTLGAPRVRCPFVLLAGYAKVVFELEAKPEFGRGSEVPRQSERRIRCDPAPAAHDLVEPGSGDSQGLGEPVHAHAEWLQDVFQDRLSRVRRRYQFRHGVLS